MYNRKLPNAWLRTVWSPPAWATLDTIVTGYLPTTKWHKWILTSNFENNAAQWCTNGWISTMYHSKAQWSYFTIKVRLLSYTPQLGHSIPLFNGSVFSGTHCINTHIISTSTIKIGQTQSVFKVWWRAFHMIQHNNKLQSDLKLSGHVGTGTYPDMGVMLKHSKLSRVYIYML